MWIYLVYLLAGRYLWAAQVIAVVALGALAWRSPDGWSAALAGRSAATLAVGLAALFALLMVPLALIIFLRRNQSEFPTSFTDPPGVACMVQVLLLVAAGANAALVRAR